MEIIRDYHMECCLSHIHDYILRDNPNSAYVIMCFPPFGYQYVRADNRKSCNLNGETLSCPSVTFARHVIMTSAEFYCVTLHGRIALFWYESYILRK